MKNTILYTLIILVGFSACKKDRQTKFDIEKSFPDPAVKFEDFKKAIATGTEGFKMTLEPVKGGLYGAYIKFDGSSAATFVGDNNPVNAGTPKSTKYSLTISQTNSTLGFEKVGNFAAFANSVGADTSYTYKESVGDTLKLIGNVSGAKMNLIKVAKKDADEYLAGKMVVPITAVSALKTFKKYFKRLTVGGKSYDLNFDDIKRRLTINYVLAGKFATFSTLYSFSNNGVDLKNTLTDGAIKINALNDLVLNSASSSLSTTINALPGVISNEIAPVAVDKAAAESFLSVPDKQWVSTTGFTKEGVVDYLDVRSITGFARLIHWVGYDADYDLIGFVFGNSIRYGPAVVPHIGTDGVMVFEFLGVLGTLPTANPDRAKVVTTINNFIDAKGYYVVRTGLGSFDLVAVNGGNLWISYQ